MHCRTPTIKAPEYQAPSWPWASLLPGATAVLPREDIEISTPFIKVVAIDMTLAGSDHIGAVTKCVLRIQCGVGRSLGQRNGS